MANKAKSRGLGRGLSALMADVTPEPTVQAGAVAVRKADQMMPIEKVHPNPDQPRRTFTQDQLDDLAASVKEKGVIQPLIVRPDPKDDGTYEIVAGERRWRASQMAQLHEIPVIIRTYTDTEALEVAIIENIQRADLNAIEEAAGYRDLMDRFGHTQEKVSEALGKSRSHIANLLRLLNLPADVQEFVRDGKLTAGHARTLVTAEEPLALAKQIIAKGLSVREAERLAKKPKGEAKPVARPKSDKDADTKALEGDLSATLGMKVSIDHKPGTEGGVVTIRYQSLDELDDICGILGA
ncbi:MULTISPECIES: ParB/RepB/Spo0J family partition protein [unclassified Aliiroseovarius]|uniref:ParB/RepB/Spo0J family partition protein n=1 Tax=unclassified Aliiroseovarius TaxID=2623558 RepID=UPI001569103C|nr:MULTISPECIES: ParB/RepB/Spo0J family partition protein [unclassified Aliiroseovarius]NRP13388.1 Chromosome-partitioning protein ParB [Aliiroseovarius sp. xm-d-517]NRP40137.1 Chromosome-partitioning protein ParB [Aliiroseovarius sp. xm-m-339-2]NRP61143.1 Chromosome-partitioning protein ParB [Aliiroseovarius sp. xm-a-151]